MSPIPSSPAGPLWEEMLANRAFYINFRVPSNGASLSGSLHRAPIEKDALFMDPSFNYLSEFPVIGPPMILDRTPVEKGAHLQSLLKSLEDDPPAKFTSRSPMVRDVRF